MPEEGLETAELREQLEEGRHHAEGHGHHEGGPKWITYLSFSTAFIAAVAAVASLYSGSFANEAIVVKNDAVLLQAKATDQWTYYQSKKIKQHLFETQSDIMPADKVEAAKKKAESEAEEAKKVQAEARDLDKQVEEKNAHSAHDLHLHHLFARSVTIFQVAIALAAIAALAKRKLMWWVSLVGGALGVFFFVQGLIAEHPSAGAPHGGQHGGGPAASSAPEQHH